ncbi:hypothetical protein ES703_13770 [subsurface metagenome]
MGRDGFDIGAGPNMPRPANKQRHPHAALVHAPLAALHSPIIAIGVGTVIGEEQHDGVSSQVQLVELPQQPADVVVQAFGHGIGAGGLIIQALGLVFVKIPVRYLPRRVGRVVGQVTEKGALPVLLDEGHGRIGQHVADIALGFNGLAVAIQGSVEIIVPVASTETKELVEALTVGVVGIMRAVVPLTKASGCITGLFEDLGVGDLIAAHILLATSDTVRASAEAVSPG